MNYSWWKYERGKVGRGGMGNIKYIFLMLLTFPIYSFQRHFSFLLFISSCVCHDIYAYFFVALFFHIQTHTYTTWLNLTHNCKESFYVMSYQVVPNFALKCSWVKRKHFSLLILHAYALIKKYYYWVASSSASSSFSLSYPYIVCCCITTP